MTNGKARVLIVGGGARSHTLGEALKASPSVGKVVFAPGTSGLERLGYETIPVASLLEKKGCFGKLSPQLLPYFTPPNSSTKMLVCHPSLTTHHPHYKSRPSCPRAP